MGTLIVALVALPALVAATLAMAIGVPRAAPAGPSASSTASRQVVIAELFTSEGCSSCPAADALLRDWLSRQPVQGVEFVALGEHVDYWDRLGWRDPYSSGVFSRRQSEYAAAFKSDRIYTPQLIVDGRLECVGSDVACVQRAVREAARQPKARVSIATTVAGKDLAARIVVEVPMAVVRRAQADIMLAVTEDDVETRVLRGENGGVTLRHSAVTRTLVEAGTLEASGTRADVTVAVPISADWTRRHLRLVAFVQERETRRIIGGGSIALAPMPEGSNPARGAAR